MLHRHGLRAVLGLERGLLVCCCYGAVPSLTTLTTMRCQSTVGSRYPSTMHTNYPDNSVFGAPLLSSPVTFHSPPNSQDHPFTPGKQSAVDRFLRATAGTAIARLSHRNSVCLSVRPSVRPSVCLSHGWIRQKRCKLGSSNLHHRLPQGL